jgi:hypothetical protein
MTTIRAAPRHKRLALLAGMVLAGPVTALDVALPRLEDLRPRFEAVTLGMSPEEVLSAMGSPSGRTETQAMGVPHLTLEWRDLSHQYVARLLGGRLYFKQSTDTR